jgi:hypothetical protein
MERNEQISKLQNELKSYREKEAQYKLTSLQQPVSPVGDCSAQSWVVIGKSKSEPEFIISP